MRFTNEEMELIRDWYNVYVEEHGYYEENIISSKELMKKILKFHKEKILI